MSQSNVPDFAELLAGARQSAVHLEMRDAYGVGDEAEDFENFKRTGIADTDPESNFWPDWLPIVKDTLARGVVMRRARIVSEPVTDYIRYEHALTVTNLAAGEQVRWLPRRLTSDIPLPGNDFWLIDDRLVCFHFFTGAGDWATPGFEVREDTPAVKLASTAFETVWERGIPHDQFTV